MIDYNMALTIHPLSSISSMNNRPYRKTSVIFLRILLTCCSFCGIMTSRKVISMITEFKVKGFKNFKEEISINFSDVRDYKFNPECISGSTISKMIIYGKNSVGKTNIGLALFDIVNHTFPDKTQTDLYDYYLNADSVLGCAEFSYKFKFSDDTIEYQYTKNDRRELLSEKVYINNALFFSYNFYKGEGENGTLKEYAPTLRLDSLNVISVLNYVANNASLGKEHAVIRMLEFISHMLWFKSVDKTDHIGYHFKTSDYYDFLFERNLIGEFQEFLHNAGINDNLKMIKDPDGKRSLYFDTTNPMPFFKVASSGTIALYTFFYWYKTAKNVSLLFIDEFDAFYHFELSESIVKMLERMTNTQIILTSHNTNLLTNRIMRPDCYFILSENKLTSFANATTRELREGHNLEKLYMSGEFNG